MFYNKNKNYGTKSDFNYYSIIILTSICYLLYFVFNIFINCYILYHKKKLCILWIDCCTLIFGGI